MYNAASRTELDPRDPLAFVEAGTSRLGSAPQRQHQVLDTYVAVGRNEEAPAAIDGIVLYRHLGPLGDEACIPGQICHCLEPLFVLSCFRDLESPATPVLDRDTRVALKILDERIVEAKALQREVVQRPPAWRFDERRDNSCRCAGRSAPDLPRIEDLDAKSSPRELVGDDAADDASAGNCDSHFSMIVRASAPAAAEKGTLIGEREWTERVAEEYGLEFTLRSKARPTKEDAGAGALVVLGA